MFVPFIARLAASLCLMAGLAVLYLRWRDRHRGRWLVAVGWGLVAAGVFGWLMSGHGDVTLSDGIVAVMMAALAGIVAHGVTLPAKVKATRLRAESEHDGLDLGQGYWSRAAARTLGCIAAAPAFGLLMGTLWRAYVPGDEADTIMMMAVIACIATPAAWVIQLASTRPWRAFAALGAASAILAAVIYLPMGLRA